MAQVLTLSSTTRGRYLQILRALCRRAIRSGVAPAQVATAFGAVSSRRPQRAPRLLPRKPQAPSAPVRWYAFKLRRNSEADRFIGRMAQIGVKTYYPTAEFGRRVGGQIRKSVRPVLPSVVFLHTSADRFDLIVSAAEALGNFIGSARPTPIPDDEMRTFALVIDRLTPDMTVIPATDADWAVGRQVAITDGPFAGYSGLVAQSADPADPRSGILIRLLHHRLKVLAHIPTPFLISK